MAQPEIKETKKGIRLFITKLPLDGFFVTILLVLLGIGLIMCFSASFASAYFKTGDSYFYIKKQVFFAALGLVAMFVISRINYNYLRVIAIPFYGVSIALLLLTELIGSSAGGAGRWLVLGPINLQPSELAKLAVIMLLSLYVAVNYTKMKKFKNGLLIPGIIMGIPTVLVVIEPHLSGAILIVCLSAAILIVGGVNMKWFGALGGVAVAGAIFVITRFDYMQSRIQMWLHPETDPQGAGFQTLQSLYAIGSGGLFGLGLGKSRQKYLYLPEPQNDFIFSIVCEELGFIGALIIIILFALLCYRGFVIAWSAPDKFGTFLVVGIITQVAVQTLLNIAVVSNAIPVTGISLPFFSYGGTSLCLLLAQMGIVLSVSRQSRLRKE